MEFLVISGGLRDDARMTRAHVFVSTSIVLALIASGCSGSSADATSSTVTTIATTVASTSAPSSTVTTTTTAPPTTTTTAPTTTTTTTAPTTTTTAPTTTTTTTPPDPPPAAVGGLTVQIGGGSGEVIPEWDRNAEPDIAGYRLWYSDDPGAAKVLLAELPHDPSALSAPAYNHGDRIAYVDLRAQIEGKHCYQVSAFDLGGHEGQRSPEVCLPVTPTTVPTGFEVGLGGGSGEVAISWHRIPDADADHYNLWYSEWPGGTKTLLAAVAHDPSALTGPAYDVGGGVTMYIDFPRTLEDNRNCYQLSAVDSAGHESARTGELCSTGL